MVTSPGPHGAPCFPNGRKAFASTDRFWAASPCLLVCGAGSSASLAPRHAAVRDRLLRTQSPSHSGAVLTGSILSSGLAGKQWVRLGEQGKGCGVHSGLWYTARIASVRPDNPDAATPALAPVENAGRQPFGDVNVPDVIMDHRSQQRAGSKPWPQVAVLIPCYNEEVAITRVVAAFRAALPQATIYVYDNNSRDGTIAAARAAGAVVRTEALQGKGHVVRRMFSDVEADAYVLVDGDDTYDADAASEMLRLLFERRLDMVTGVRTTSEEAATAAYRTGHRFGNALLTGMVRRVFGDRVSDMLSGYRVFSRRFVKSFPALASGFETETEFTVHALELRLAVGEVLTAYKARPAGSTSKLNTYRDGFRILRTIFSLVQRERPLLFFSATGSVLLVAALLLAAPLLPTYLATGLVPRYPTAVLATGLVLLASLSFTCGLILDTVTRGRQEAKRIAYLSIPGPCQDVGATPRRHGPQVS